MGNSNSSLKEPTKEEIQELASKTHFKETEILKLYAEYKKIADDCVDDKIITPEEFYPHLGISNHEYGCKIFDAFDTTKDGNMQFSEYVIGLSKVCERASVEEKAKFCFELYDKNHSGEISKEEVNDILSVSLSSNPALKIPKEQVRRIAAKLFEDIDTSNDSTVSYEEFLNFAKTKDGIVNCVSLKIQPILDE